MKNLVVALVAFAFAAPAAAAARDLAPAVKRKPAAAASAPAAPRRDVAAPASPAARQLGAPTFAGPAAPAEPIAAPSTAPVAPQRAARMTNERDVQAILAAVAAQGGGDSALYAGLIKVMSDLVIAGRCSEAAGLAAQDGRTALASHTSKLCR